MLSAWEIESPQRSHNRSLPVTSDEESLEAETKSSSLMGEVREATLFCSVGLDWGAEPSRGRGTTIIRHSLPPLRVQIAASALASTCQATIGAASASPSRIGRFALPASLGRSFESRSFIPPAFLFLPSPLLILPPHI